MLDLEWEAEEKAKHKHTIKDWLLDPEVQTASVVAVGCVVVLLCIAL